MKIDLTGIEDGEITIDGKSFMDQELVNDIANTWPELVEGRERIERLSKANEVLKQDNKRKDAAIHELAERLAQQKQLIRQMSNDEVRNEAKYKNAQEVVEAHYKEMNRLGEEVEELKTTLGLLSNLTGIGIEILNLEGAKADLAAVEAGGQPKIKTSCK